MSCQNHENHLTGETYLNSQTLQVCLKRLQLKPTADWEDQQEFNWKETLRHYHEATDHLDPDSALLQPFVDPDNLPTPGAFIRVWTSIHKPVDALQRRVLFLLQKVRFRSRRQSFGFPVLRLQVAERRLRPEWISANGVFKCESLWFKRSGFSWYLTRCQKRGGTQHWKNNLHFLCHPYRSLDVH